MLFGPGGVAAGAGDTGPCVGARVVGGSSVTAGFDGLRVGESDCRRDEEELGDEEEVTATGATRL